MATKNAEVKEWTVIGAGAAGISYLTQLLSTRLDSKDALWIDQEFNGGAFKDYQDVPGNTKVSGFITWATANSELKKLASHSSNPLEELRKLNPEDTCGLGIVHKVMARYTKLLQQQVDHRTGYVCKLEFDNNSSVWNIFIKQNSSAEGTNSNQNQPVVLKSRNVCLATGAKPLVHTNLHLGLPNKETISFSDALNLNYLKTNVKSGDVIGIVGGSHSAFVMMYLFEQLNIPNLSIVNFYKGEVRYAVYKKDFILYDNTGLKGKVGAWAKSILEGKAKTNFGLTRINVATEEQKVSEYIPRCSKFIYAHGFVKSMIPEIIYKLPEAVGFDEVKDVKPNIAPFLEYSNINGRMMVPSSFQDFVPVEGLYGFGYGFPEKIITRVGEMEYNIGLMKFGMCAERWISMIKM